MTVIYILKCVLCMIDFNILFKLRYHLTAVFRKYLTVDIDLLRPQTVEVKILTDVNASLDNIAPLYDVISNL